MSHPSLLDSFMLKWLSGIDFILFFALAILITLGVMTLYSASGAEMAMMQRQGLHILVATGLMLLLSRASSKTLQQWSIWIYVFGVIVLILVLLLGTVGKGAQRWLDLGIIRFQPSEVMKLAVPMMIASYYSDRPLPPRFSHVIISALLVIVPVLLIAKQPDLGTSLLVASAGFFVIFFAGISWTWLISLFVGILVAAPLLFHFGMHPYQQRRIMTLLNPGSDPLGTGYHINQSMIAIGSGGMEGKGWMLGDQSRLDFLPERHTDFIFAVFGEEFGLMGIGSLFVLYLFIIYRGLFLAIRGQDTYSRLLGGSLAMTFFVYLFVNVGMVSGVLPVVGVPLPLVSYGGTSFVTLLAAFGLLMGMRRRKHRFR